MTATSVLIANLENQDALELKGLLEQLGYHVVAVTHTSEESIQKTRDLKPDIALMKMRFTGSKDVNRTDKLIHELGRIPVVYVMDIASQSTIRRAGTTGPFGYIFRPFDKNHILAIIETALIRHQLERKLQESRQWLNAILTSVGDGVVSTDEKGLIRFMNPAAVQLTAWQEAEAIGRPFYEVFLVGQARAMALALTADKVSAEQAEQWGLIWKCFEDDRLMPEVRALALRFANGPTRAYSLIKQALYASSGNSLEQQLALEASLQRQAGNSPDFREGVQAFLDKRPARFTGR